MILLRIRDGVWREVETSHDEERQGVADDHT
jgi:hypothetical protein